MKVVTYNIRYGMGLDGRIDLERIVDAVRDADIIAFQEVERFWQHSGMVNQPQQLARMLPDHYWAYYPAFDVDASYRDNDQLVNRRRQFGPMLLSRWPILSVRRLALPHLKTVDIFNFVSGALEGVINTPIGDMRVYSLHLSSVSVRERLLQIDTLLAEHRRMTKQGGVFSAGTGSESIDTEADNFARMNWSNGEPAPPGAENALLLGDFNMQPNGLEYARIVGNEDPLYGYGLHDDDFIDTWTQAGDDNAESLSWWPDPPDRVPQKPLRLDYCFASARLAGQVSRAWIDTSADGSDHKPCWVKFQ